MTEKERLPHVLLPQGWARPKGYSQGMAARGLQIYISGQVGWDVEGRFHSTRLADQVRQALLNIVAILASAGAAPSHVVRLTWYVTSREEYYEQLAEIGAAYRAAMGRHYPSMSVVQVVALMEKQARVEIEATAVLPDAASPAAASPGASLPAASLPDED
jgi:enamine deaminase RidA (YjgF/YER057c/UK114 family)